MRSGGAQHPEEIVNFLDSRLIISSGIFNKSGGGFAVEQETVPAMSVKVAQGYAFLRKSDGSMVYPVRLSGADASAVIGANSSGNSRIDAVVLYIDLSASANSDISNVAKLAVVAGTPAGSPVAPSDGDIQTALGASNPFIRLANVTVASGAVSIVTANISNKAPSAKLTGQTFDWMDADGNWTASDANTISIDQDLTAVLQKGDKIKLVNNAATKYYYIATAPAYAASATTFDVAGETDLVAGAITSPQYSKIDNPQGFKKGEMYYKASAYLSALQATTNGTVNKINLNTEDFDVNANYDTATYKYTAPIAGYYDISAAVSGQCTNRIARVQCQVRKNGSATPILQARTDVEVDGETNISSFLAVANVEKEVYLAKGDYIELYGMVYGDAGQNFSNGTGLTFLSVRFSSI